MKMLWLCCIEAAPSSIILFDTAFKNSLVMGFVSSADWLYGLLLKRFPREYKSGLGGI